MPVVVSAARLTRRWKCSQPIFPERLPFTSKVALATLPFLGATAFHLFTTYPIEPRWIAKRRAIRWVPYAIAGVIVVGVWSQAVSPREFFAPADLERPLAADASRS